MSDELDPEGINAACERLRNALLDVIAAADQSPAVVASALTALTVDWLIGLAPTHAVAREVLVTAADDFFAQRAGMAQHPEVGHG